ncbi:MAG: orotate phosphoribosyltransferase [Paracoccus denitrificans]|uniref:Orotate phosphoribosyltransferase n=1 Tax=Paracoccus denitrificans TaxID=266 RepID=A0A533I2X4_PARDE|nr:MAG: orotate phosphoribosyltransferase [Paracoccus denitrificans]
MAQHFPDQKLMARMSARMLLELGAIRFATDRPFMFTSGLASPVYVDCKRVISYPALRGTLLDFLLATIDRDIGRASFDVVAGGESAGIPFASWIAAKLSLPMVFVRKSPRGLGPQASIEGDLDPGARVLLIEDLTTDGASKLQFCKALRRAGAVVDDAVVLFFYNIYTDTQASLSRNGLRLHWLADWWAVLEAAREMGVFGQAELTDLEQFLHAPLEWSGEHGGATRIGTG